MKYLGKLVVYYVFFLKVVKVFGIEILGFIWYRLYLVEELFFQDLQCYYVWCEKQSEIVCFCWLFKGYIFGKNLFVEGIVNINRYIVMLQEFCKFKGMMFGEVGEVFFLFQ